MENIGMFIMGSIVCALYLTGYLYMIKYANDSHDSDLKKDIEKANKSQSKNDKKNNIWFNVKKKPYSIIDLSQKLFSLINSNSDLNFINL